MSLSLQGQLLELNAPICSPATGSYSVAYRNSIATGCSTGRNSDDFATLLFTGTSAATYTMPQSKVTTFTGSISGTTLTTPANAVIIGSVITGVGVIDNTYVTATTNSTTWTVNNSQTVASETLTQSVFPPGHGTCIKSDTSATAVLTVAATISAISGAAGVTGATVPLNPGGEVCLQATTGNQYEAMGYLPGVASGIQVVASNSCASVSNVACTTSATNVVGANLIVGCLGWYSGAGGSSAFSDNVGNPYTSIYSTGHGSQVGTLVYSYLPTVTSSMTFTASSPGGNTNTSLTVMGFSGTVSPPLDQSTNPAASASGSTTLSPGSLTPSQANELLVSCLAGTPTPTIASPFTLGPVVPAVSSVAQGSALGYQIQAPGPAAENPAWSWSGAAEVVAGMATFK